MKRTRNIAFIVELLLLFVILLFVIVTITRTFMTSRRQSLYARHLTEAVTLAENMAEVTRHMANRESAAARLSEMEEVQEAAAADDDMLRVTLVFTGENGRRDPFEAELLRSEEKTGVGSFITENIALFYDGGTEPIYEMETGWYQEAEDK